MTFGDIVGSLHFLPRKKGKGLGNAHISRKRAKKTQRGPRGIDGNFLEN
jgi:hypothetical protein